MSFPPTLEKTRARFLLAVLCLLVAGTVLRVAWLAADPPTHSTVGIVWHDEGPWVHNARNRALWGTWRTDAWNPVFVAPVFTALEYGAFSTFGVGTWQARTVPVVSGLAAVVLLVAGLTATAGRRAALIGGALLTSNYVFVMWNRAALMESTMTALLVAAWAACALAERHPRAGWFAGLAIVLAWFTKASAAFFAAAVIIDAGATILLSLLPSMRRRLSIERPATDNVRAAYWTLAGLGMAAAICVAVFVLPHWSEYRFYNWQMSVMRKPAYTAEAFIDRASWIPIVHDFFTRMWLLLVIASLSLALVTVRLRTAKPSERLLVLWVALGLAELVVHDSGNERRFVMFIPALVALAAILLGDPGRIASTVQGLRGRARWLALPILLPLAYLVVGSIVRLAFLYQVKPGVRWSAAGAVALVAVVMWRWREMITWLSRQKLHGRAVAALVAVMIAGDLAQYAQWASRRTYENYEASKAVGQALPPGTLVHGKLANGLSLENRIRPIFVGRGFGNYADRKTRDDVRYILTYIAPRVGYEGSVIHEVLDAYPTRSIIMTFDVAETATGHDRAALIDKFGGTPGREKN